LYRESVIDLFWSLPEKLEGIPQQKLYLTFYTKKDAQQWLDKWASRSKSYHIVRARLTYPFAA
jgi:hypothetical protein